MRKNRVTRTFLTMMAGVALAIFAVTWLLLAPAIGVWSEVQHSSARISRGSSSTQPLSLYASLWNGNCVAIFVAWSTKTPTQLMGISDGTNTYMILDTSTDGASYAMATAYNLKVIGGPKALMFTFDRPVGPVFMTADEFTRGCSAVAGHGIGAQTHPGAETDAVSSGDIVAPTSGDLLWGVSFHGGLDYVEYAPGTGFTKGASSNSDMMTEWLSQGSNTAVTFTVSPSSATITAGIQFAP
jgi:hypothetical protein